jgi:hypothetical protein
MLTGPPSIWRRLLWLALTGDFRSPLRHIPENVPFRVIRVGQRLDVQAVPVPVVPNHTKFFRPQSRVKVRADAGFNPRALGTVTFHAPDDRVWVLRDGSSKEVFFYPYELELIECSASS